MAERNEIVLQDRFVRSLDKAKESDVYTLIRRFVAGKSRIRKKFEDLIFLDPQIIKQYISEYTSQSNMNAEQYLEFFININELGAEIRDKRLSSLSKSDDDDRKFILSLLEYDPSQGGQLADAIEAYVNQDPRNRRNFLILNLIGSGRYIINYVNEYQANSEKIRSELEEASKIEDEFDKKNAIDSIDTPSLSPQVFLINYISKPEIRLRLLRSKNKIQKLYSQPGQLEEPTGEMRNFLISAGIFPETKRQIKLIGRRKNLKQRPQAPLDINPKYVELPKPTYSKPSDLLSLYMNYDETATEIAREVATTALREAIPDDTYANSIEVEIYAESATFQEYFSRIARITVPLTYVGIKDYAQLFSRRINKEFYNPETLPFISESEIFGEIFENPNISNDEKERVLNILSRTIERMVNAYAYSTISILYPERRIRFNVPSEPINLGVENIPLQSYCSDNPDVSSDNFIIYKDPETGTLYCFTIFELINRFVEADYKNPYTDKPFSNEFILKVRGFDPERVTNSYFEEIFGPEEEREEEKVLDTTEEQEELAPGFIDILLADIESLEEGIIPKETSSSEDKQKACEYCKKYISEKDVLNSVIYENRKPRIISFCSTECFGKVEF